MSWTDRAMLAVLARIMPKGLRAHRIPPPSGHDGSWRVFLRAHAATLLAGELHLHAILSEYIGHYNTGRSHQGEGMGLLNTGDDPVKFPVDPGELDVAEVPEPGDPPPDPLIVPAHRWTILA
jgi:hypothetical protein